MVIKFPQKIGDKIKFGGLKIKNWRKKFGGLKYIFFSTKIVFLKKKGKHYHILTVAIHTHSNPFLS